MSDTPTRKELTHTRIVRTASRAIRRKGYDGISVADIMKEAGLTHGGFYAHFPSRTAMLAEAADCAGEDGIKQLSKAANAVPAQKALHALIDEYLTEEHVATPERGCPIVALGSEMPRQAPEVRHAATRRIKELIGLIERQMPGWGKAETHDKAIAVLGCMVGSLLLARAVDDPALSDSVREASRRFLHECLD